MISMAIFSFASAQTSPSKSFGPEGMWKCSAPNAPYQYQVFNLQVSKVNDQYSGKLMGDGGVEMQLDNVTFKDSTLEFGLYVEGTPVHLKLKYDGVKLAGVAATDQGDIGITAERPEATEKKATDSIPGTTKK